MRYEVPVWVTVEASSQDTAWEQVNEWLAPLDFTTDPDIDLPRSAEIGEPRLQPLEWGLLARQYVRRLSDPRS